MSNLLDKASIILTPTAYNNGKALCVKPSDGSGDFDFSRNSAATRVNAQGLVENVQILSSNLVQNGDFSEEGVQEVSNGSFSQEGVELLSQPVNLVTDFTTNSGGVIVDADTFTTSGGAVDGIKKSSFLTVGKSYKLIIEGDTTSSGFTLGILVNGNEYGSGFGTHYFKATTQDLWVRQQTLGTTNITSFSIVEVGQDWTLGTGWSIGEDKVVADNVSSNTIQNLSSIDANKSYNISFNISDYLGGQFFITFGGNDNTINFTANGSYSVYINPTNTVNNIFYLRGNGFTGSITNISVKEVGMDWELETGWSIANGKAVVTNAPALYQRLSQPSLSFTLNSTYEISITCSEYSSGFIYLRKPRGTEPDTSLRIDNVGTFVFTLKALTELNEFALAIGSVGTDLSISNISLIEITTDTNLPRINYENFSFDGSGNIIPDSGCGSWLFEPQTTQLLPYSEDFSQSSWSKGSDISIESGYLAPDGNNTAYKVTKTGGGAPYLSRNQSLITTTTRSIYARTVSGTGTATLLSHNSNTNNLFTLTEQWQRFELSDTASSSGLSSFYAADFRGSGTLTEYLVWGANATNDQDYATSYIPSNGSTVTRNQDVCTNGATGAGLINSTEGTLYFEGSVLANTTSFRIISLSDATNSNAVAFVYRNTPNDFTAVVKSGGATSLSKTTILADVTDTIKAAISYKLNDFKFYVNGVLILADTSGNTPIGLNNLQFTDTNGTSNPFFGKTKALAVFPYLTDAELTELTTI